MDAIYKSIPNYLKTYTGKIQKDFFYCTYLEENFADKTVKDCPLIEGNLIKVEAPSKFNWKLPSKNHTSSGDHQASHPKTNIHLEETSCTNEEPPLYPKRSSCRHLERNQSGILGYARLFPATLRFHARSFPNNGHRLRVASVHLFVCPLHGFITP